MAEIRMGIDLGTTNSCVAIYRNDRVEILQNESGSRTTPSWVTFTKDDVLKGQEAVDVAHMYPRTSIFEAKRLIGQKFDNPKVRADIERFPFPVINDLGAPRIRIELDGGDVQDYYPEDISSYVLERMKTIAQTACDGGVAAVTRAVVTVPAYFNDAQRKATKNAAKIAGFVSCDIINEPTAAALAFDHQKQSTKSEEEKKKKENVLVYDFGGGTFDVSVVKVGGSLCNVVATSGDSHLGGTDIDALLVEDFKRDYARQHGVQLDCEDYSVAERLKKMAETTKRTLSGEGVYEYSFELLSLGPVAYRRRMSRAEFQQIAAPIFDKTMDRVRNCLRDCNLDVSKIDEVVLVGGSSKIPKVRELLADFFGSDRINRSINPDEAVAYGAALYAANLAGADKALVSSVLDVTSLTIGTNVKDDQMSVLIPRNTPLPAKCKTKYQTVFDNQPTMDFPIYQGESEKASENVLLGEFIMRDLSAAPAGGIKVEIHCTIDVDGILNVSAREISNEGKKNTKDVTIDVAKCGLTDEQIEMRVQEVRRNNARAARRLEFEEKRHSLSELLFRTREYASNLENNEDIMDRHNAISDWLPDATVDDIEQILAYQLELKTLIGLHN